MKSPAIFCMLILLVRICSVRSASLMNFGNFFQKHNDNDQSFQRIQPSGPHQQPNLNNNNNQPPPPPPLVNTNEQNRNEDDGLDQYSSESYSEYRSEPYLYNASSEQDGLPESSNSSTNETDLSAEQINENLNTSTSSTEHSISNASTTESNSNASSSESSGVVLTEVPSTPVSSTTTLGQIITSAVSNATSGKEVVLATAETTTVEVQKSILQKSLDWVKDDYVLSILVPVAAGVLFAVTVICTIALCRCCRRCCRRRRFRKKCLPDSVRNLSTSDRKRLLGDMSSDDEF